MKMIIVWYSIQNGGDGSAYPSWFLTEADAELDQDRMDEGWGEPCIGSVETFEGSDIHLKAVTCSNKLRQEIKQEEDEA